MAMGTLNELVYLYREETVNRTWTLIGNVTNPETPNDRTYFGYAVSMYGDLLAVGARSQSKTLF